MSVFEPTEQARAAAARATTLADIARRRTLVADAWSGRELLHIADLLDIVAVSFYEEEPTRADGIPSDARAALADAEIAAVDAPGTGFPARFGQYIRHALDRGPLTVSTSRGLTSAYLVDEDAQLASALDTLHGHLASAATETIVQALLEAVFVLHGKRADFADLTRG
ncbi:hypothetical protein [Streptomyces sp. NPDC087538]|uniref:hypothetical protein n=1 Tax=Streptomyces sp. NPDC087538 TaxID=3365797 RepID=UPI003800DA3D